MRCSIFRKENHNVSGLFGTVFSFGCLLFYWIFAVKPASLSVKCNQFNFHSLHVSTHFCLSYENIDKNSWNVREELCHKASLLKLRHSPIAHDQQGTEKCKCRYIEGIGSNNFRGQRDFISHFYQFSSPLGIFSAVSLEYGHVASS